MPTPISNDKSYILNLQRYLRLIADTEDDIPRPPLDGIFDSATENSLRAYQASRRLPVTGRADFETWEHLYADYLLALEKTAPANGLYLFPDTPIDFAVYPDEEYFLVMIIQYILNELRLIYDDIPQNTLSGNYDAKTRQGVLAFQRHQGLSQTDRVDRATWNALVDAHNRLFDGGKL